MYMDLKFQHNINHHDYLQPHPTTAKIFDIKMVI